MRHGKIAIGLVLVIITITLSLLAISSIDAATSTSSSYTVGIPNNPAYEFTDIDNAYLIITDIRTGDMYKSTGAIETTYATAAIAFTKDAQNTDWAIATMPALPKNITFAVLVYENASPTLGDTIKAGPWLYNQSSGMFYTDTNPVQSGRVSVTQATYD